MFIAPFRGPGAPSSTSGLMKRYSGVDESGPCERFLNMRLLAMSSIWLWASPFLRALLTFSPSLDAEISTWYLHISWLAPWHATRWQVWNVHNEPKQSTLSCSCRRRWSPASVPAFHVRRSIHSRCALLLYVLTWMCWQESVAAVLSRESDLCNWPFHDAVSLWRLKYIHVWVSPQAASRSHLLFPCRGRTWPDSTIHSSMIALLIGREKCSKSTYTGIVDEQMQSRFSSFYMLV